MLNNRIDACPSRDAEAGAPHWPDPGTDLCYFCHGRVLPGPVTETGRRPSGLPRTVRFVK